MAVVKFDFNPTRDGFLCIFVRKIKRVASRIATWQVRHNNAVSMCFIANLDSNRVLHSHLQVLGKGLLAPAQLNIT